MASDTQKVRIVCISDTHNHAPGEGYTLPKGDVLVHAGDLTNQGSLKEVKKAVNWIENADFPAKFVIAGNHDLSLDREYDLKHPEGWTVMPKDVKESRKLLEEGSVFTYLGHKAISLELPLKDTRLRIFASPYSPDRGGQNWAFQYTEDKAETLWSEVPDNVDVLITHTPPAGHCGKSTHWQQGGCPALLEALWRIRPILHICGHCHEGRGAEVLRWADSPGTAESSRKWEDPSAGTKKQSLLDLTSGRGGMALEAGEQTAVVNASIMARSFGRGAKAFNKPIVIDLELPVRCPETLTDER